MSSGVSNPMKLGENDGTECEEGREGVEIGGFDG